MLKCVQCKAMDVDSGVCFRFPKHERVSLGHGCMSGIPLTDQVEIGERAVIARQVARAEMMREVRRELLADQELRRMVAEQVPLSSAEAPPAASGMQPQVEGGA